MYDFKKHAFAEEASSYLQREGCALSLFDPQKVVVVSTRLQTN